MLPNAVDQTSPPGREAPAFRRRAFAIPSHIASAYSALCSRSRLLRASRAFAHFGIPASALAPAPKNTAEMRSSLWIRATGRWLFGAGRWSDAAVCPPGPNE